MINYSIIIPHKNCLELLRRCLDSIPQRPDIEVIVIDDNSEIENFREKVLSFTSLLNIGIHCIKESLGAGGARNVGLKAASGKWLVFADSDDFFATDAFTIMDEYIDSTSDIIYFGHDAVFSKSLLPASRLGKRMHYINEYIETKSDKSEAYLKYFNHSPTSKMIKRELIDQYHIIFDQVPASNDAMFSVKSAYYAEKIEVDDRIIYITTIREGSITQTRNKKNDYARYLVDLDLYDFFREHNMPHLYPFLTMRLIDSLRYYGVCEFLRYLSLAKQRKVNVFLGLTRRFIKKYRY